MGTPNTWRDCRLSSGALDRTELILGKCANRIIVVPLHSIQSSALAGTRRLAGGMRSVPPESVRSLPHHQISSFHCG
jgi:hypothetical protein